MIFTNLLIANILMSMIMQNWILQTFYFIMLYFKLELLSVFIVYLKKNLLQLFIWLSIDSVVYRRSWEIRPMWSRRCTRISNYTLITLNPVLPMVKEKISYLELKMRSLLTPLTVQWSLMLFLLWIGNTFGKQPYITDAMNDKH